MVRIIVLLDQVTFILRPLTSFTIHLGGHPICSPFHMACSLNSINLVLLFLDKGIDVNLRGASGKTPLHYAVLGQKPSEEFVKMLVSRGADVNAVDQTGRTILYDLLYHASPTTLAILKYLLQNGAEVNNNNKPELDLLSNALR